MRLRSVENQRFDFPLIALLCVSDNYLKTQSEQQYHVISSYDDKQITASSDKILSLTRASGFSYLKSLMKKQSNKCPLHTGTIHSVISEAALIYYYCH